MIVLDRVLSVNDLEHLTQWLGGASFVDGRATSALASKRNLQVPNDSPDALAASELVAARLRAHTLFGLATQSCAMTAPLFSAYHPGMSYPDHVDVAVMGTLRTDLAATIFVSTPDQYDGGELVIDTGAGVRRFRLVAGDAVVYPACFVHHVAPVTRGVRFAAVLWIQSLIRDHDRRSILRELGLAKDELSATACGPRLNRAYWNLLRLWVETAPMSAGQ